MEDRCGLLKCFKEFLKISGQGEACSLFIYKIGTLKLEIVQMLLRTSVFWKNYLQLTRDNTVSDSYWVFLPREPTKKNQLEFTVFMVL